MLNTAMKILDHDIKHISVMAGEIGKWLQPREGGTYLDATLGFGGHTLEILERSNYNCRIVALDIDENAIEHSRRYLGDYPDNITFVYGNFALVDKIANDLGISKFDGIVADLGMSSYQIDHSGRGFSFMRSEFLDMRMDRKTDLTAFEIINNFGFDDLVKIFRQYGEERFSKNISEEIVRIRKTTEINNTRQLAAIVEASIPVKFHSKNIHPATRIFQALRIAVNNELENLAVFIDTSVNILNSGARLAVISFHSLEDSIVKNKFRSYSENCICPPGMPQCGCGKKQVLKLLTRKSVKPSAAEIDTNRRSRSARLRVAEKI